METEYSIDDIFGGQLYNFGATMSSTFAEKVGRELHATSEKVKQSDGFMFKPFVVTDQNTGTALYYREFPLPW